MFWYEINELRHRYHAPWVGQIWCSSCIIWVKNRITISIINSRMLLIIHKRRYPLLKKLNIVQDWKLHKTVSFIALHTVRMAHYINSYYCQLCQRDLHTVETLETLALKINMCVPSSVCHGLINLAQPVFFQTCQDIYSNVQTHFVFL